ncbi:MAG: exodeoxyribonuclease VII large subunit [Phycisphaerales bacterium]|nr:MAG: exodeoxyribonuclease VII large subunit [Phycisphaerales bacterium]
MPTPKKIYTVSQINSLVKVALEENLPPRLIVRGQIGDWKRHTSGHCYFSLKDEAAVLPCIMWASKFRAVKFTPEDGMAALATGHVDVYTPGGRYQLNVDKLEPAGVGTLQLAFEQMVRKLQSEGLFDEAHKRTLPPYPARIGILTSESGAAVHDIIDSIRSRWPCGRLSFYPVPVQGEGAAAKIAAALRDINRRNRTLRLDVLIIGRGGGSLEDLWAFNEEILARAVFDSQIPVISAVGHEVDTTIADLVADARASTPTKAGVVAVPDVRDVWRHLSALERTLTNHAKATAQLARQNLLVVLASAVFRDPLVLVQNAGQRLDELTADLTEQMRQSLVEAQRKVTAGYEQIVRIEPHRLLGRKTVELSDWQNRAKAGVNRITNDCRIRLTAQENRLTALNPKSVLQRGYSITTSKKTGSLVRASDDVHIGEELFTELAGENFIESKVTKK